MFFVLWRTYLMNGWPSSLIYRNENKSRQALASVEHVFNFWKNTSEWFFWGKIVKKGRKSFILKLSRFGRQFSYIRSFTGNLADELVNHDRPFSPFDISGREQQNQYRENLKALIDVMKVSLSLFLQSNIAQIIHF